jgi:hypothetical protein
MLYVKIEKREEKGLTPFSPFALNSFTQKWLSGNTLLKGALCVSKRGRYAPKQPVLWIEY